MSSKTFHNKTVVVTARPRSKRLREAGGYYAAMAVGKSASNGGQAVIEGGLNDLFEEILDSNGTVIGIKPIYDLHIIQVAGDETLGAEDQLKNITELLRMQERVNLGTTASPEYGIKFYGGIVSEGDIVAYGSAAGGGSPAAYDRLDPVSDTWPAYDATKAGWILSAALGWNLQERIEILEQSSGGGSDHSHTNLSLLEAITAERMAAWDAGGGSGSGETGHTHANLAVLNEITELKVEAWDTVASLFTAMSQDNRVIGITAHYPLTVSGGVFASGDVVAYGSAAGGSSPAAYDRLDPVNGVWPAKDNEKAGWILSAALGWDLNDRLTAAETDIMSLGARVTALENGGGGGSIGHTHANLAVLNEITALKVEAWNTVASLFTATSQDNTIVGITANYPLTVSGGVFASGDVVAYGSAAGGSSPAAYDRLDPVNGVWPTYDASKLGWILSAALGWDLVDRVQELEQGGSGGSGHTHSNLALLESITSERVAAWDAGGGSGSGETGHTHTNLAALNNITQTKISNWDDAASSAHSHSNKTVLDGITAQLINRWNSAWANIGIANYDTNNKALATRDWVNQQGFLTAHQSLAGYATQAWVNQQGFLTAHQSLDGYAKTTDLHSHSNKAALDSITSTKVNNWDNTYSVAHSHSNKTALDGITSGKVSCWDDAYSAAHSHSNKTALDGITTAKVNSWDAAYSAAHSHSNKTVLDGITTAKVNSWDEAAAGSWLPLTGGTLSGALAGTTLAMRTGSFGDASNAGSISIIRKISSRTYTATVSIDNSGNIVITPTSTGIIICAGIVEAAGDVVAYE